MPRIILDSTKPYAREIEIFANIKKNIPDVLPDLRCIYQVQLKRFRNCLYDFDVNTLKGKIQNLKNYEITQITKNRIYIVTNVDYIPFVLVDMDEAVVEHLIDVYSLLEINAPDYLTPDFISTLFVFKGTRLHYKSDIRPHDVAKLIAVFKNENIYNFSGARDDMYAKPRRNAF